MFSFFRRKKKQENDAAANPGQPQENRLPQEAAETETAAAPENTVSATAAHSGLTEAQPAPLADTDDMPAAAEHSAAAVNMPADDAAVTAARPSEQAATDVAEAATAAEPLAETVAAQTETMPSENAAIEAQPVEQTDVPPVEAAIPAEEPSASVDDVAAASHAMPSENAAAEAQPVEQADLPPVEAAAQVEEPSASVDDVAAASHAMPSENAAAEAQPVEQTDLPPVETAVQAEEQSAFAAAQAAEQSFSAAAVPQPEPEKTGWAARLKQGLAKSRDKMAKSLAGVFGGGKIDEDLYEELETVLITSDMGMEATEYLMKDVRKRVSLKGLSDGNELRGALKDAVYELIKPLEQPLVLPESKEPFVIMLAGINGAGKTTSIGKLAKYFQAQGKSVLLAAGDTFRAAAREQLQEWGARNNVTVISQSTGDSAAVCFDAVQAAKARGIDIVLADTAGRLPTQLHLMEEIKKVKRVLQKAMPDAPHEIIVVLDANIGQNAVNQVKAFDDALGLTGLIVTKLDGTAKGGILAALASHRPIPVRYIGVGEGIDDLRPFDARAFTDALID